MDREAATVMAELPNREIPTDPAPPPGKPVKGGPSTDPSDVGAGRNEKEDPKRRINDACTG